MTYATIEKTQMGHRFIKDGRAIGQYHSGIVQMFSPYALYATPETPEEALAVVNEYLDRVEEERAEDTQW